MTCEIQNCPYGCCESPLLDMNGRPHHHRCAVHRDMRDAMRVARRQIALPDGPAFQQGARKVSAEKYASMYHSHVAVVLYQRFGAPRRPFCLRARTLFGVETRVFEF